MVTMKTRNHGVDVYRRWPHFVYTNHKCMEYIQIEDRCPFCVCAGVWSFKWTKCDYSSFFLKRMVINLKFNGIWKNVHTF